MVRIVCFPLKSRRSGRSGGCHAPAGGGGGPWTESPARPYTDRWTLPPLSPVACSCRTHTHTHTHTTQNAHKRTHTHTHTHTQIMIIHLYSHRQYRQTDKRAHTHTHTHSL